MLPEVDRSFRPGYSERRRHNQPKDAGRHCLCRQSEAEWIEWHCVASIVGERQGSDCGCWKDQSESDCYDRGRGFVAGQLATWNARSLVIGGSTGKGKGSRCNSDFPCIEGEFVSFFCFQAIRRLVNRDNLTEEQAKQRVDAQPKNETMIKESNVVFSTQWSYEFSQQQVIHWIGWRSRTRWSDFRQFLQARKAWNGLMEYLAKRDEEQQWNGILTSAHWPAFSSKWRL